MNEPITWKKGTTPGFIISGVIMVLSVLALLLGRFEHLISSIANAASGTYSSFFSLLLGHDFFAFLFNFLYFLLFVGICLVTVATFLKMKKPIIAGIGYAISAVSISIMFLVSISDIGFRYQSVVKSIFNVLYLLIAALVSLIMIGVIAANFFAKFKLKIPAIIMCAPLMIATIVTGIKLIVNAFRAAYFPAFAQFIFPSMCRCNAEFLFWLASLILLIVAIRIEKDSDYQGEWREVEDSSSDAVNLNK